MKIRKLSEAAMIQAERDWLLNSVVNADLYEPKAEQTLKIVSFALDSTIKSAPCKECGNFMATADGDPICYKCRFKETKFPF